MEENTTGNDEPQRGASLPLVVAVTGHRDLVGEEIEPIKQRVTQLFRDLHNNYPNRPITVMSGLAEGADQLVAKIAIEMSLKLIVPLPQSRDKCLKDYETSAAREEFVSLCDAADRVLELSLDHTQVEATQHIHDTDKERQYAHMGSFLSAHCHILLALWDGKPSDKLGGTSQIVKFHHDAIMPGYAPKTLDDQKMLLDDESDLIFHIVCSRNRQNGEPASEFSPLECSWFTKDEQCPRSSVLPEHHQVIFSRGDEFSADAQKYFEKIKRSSCYLFDGSSNYEVSSKLSKIQQYFSLADWLAIHYQKRVLFTIRLTHILAFLMGLLFIIYSDAYSSTYLLVAFLACFSAASILQFVARKQVWQRKYLDYRTLAEGLRVQFFWAAAGVANENIAKFAHDNFLQTQAPEFGWIRNVMRVSGMECDAVPSQDDEGLVFAEEHWVGDSMSGQLGYFHRVAKDRIRRQKQTEFLGNLSLAVSVVVVFLLVFFGAHLADESRDYLLMIMGASLLAFAVREGYAYATGVDYLMKQYDVMFRIYNNARRRLMATEVSAEKRQIMLALGQSSLDEHADWMAMQRDRSLRQQEIWRISG